MLNIIPKTKFEKNCKKKNVSYPDCNVYDCIYVLLIIIILMVSFDFHKSNFVTNAKFIVVLQDWKIVQNYD